jgi:hypothetical protein
MKNSLVSILIAGSFLTSCTKNSPFPKEEKTISQVVYDAPIISSEGKKPFEKLDRNTLVNLPGFNVDFDVDGTNDFVSMRDNTLYFSKGIGEGKLENEKPIARVKGNVTAYSIRSSADQQRPYLVFFDEKDNGYIQPNLGTNTLGLPYLGDVEELK